MFFMKGREMKILKNENTKLLLRESMVLYPFIIAFCKLILGLFTPSAFLCVYALYDVGIGLAKTVDVTSRIEKPSHENNLFAYVIGWFMMTSSILFMVYSARLFFGCKIIYYSIPAAIVTAISTFLGLFTAVKSLFNPKNCCAVTKAIKLVNLSSVIISLSITREALLSNMIAGNISISIGWAGLVFGGITALISLYLIISLQKTLKKNAFSFTYRTLYHIVKRSILDFIILLTSSITMIKDEIHNAGH